MYEERLTVHVHGPDGALLQQGDLSGEVAYSSAELVPLRPAIALSALWGRQLQVRLRFMGSGRYPATPPPLEEQEGVGCDLLIVGEWKEGFMQLLGARK